ncbi:hypothetical protein GCM10023063_19510 [Arthrobacter methylotrophus]|uniref:DUF805 domain-containing protein n=1 Tax=Arthrobacter methylotrophus TaxID=121291 RepID=A0ABV5UPB6_9MICC
MSDPHQFPQGTGRQQWPSEQPRQNRLANPYAAQVHPGTTVGPVPLWAPLYGASLPEAVSRFFKKYATFTGRASRSEYWWWTLVSGGTGMVLGILMLVAGSVGAKLGPHGTVIPGPGYWAVLIVDAIVSLAIFVPNLALSVRRLHDTNKSGWMYLLVLVPLVGPLLMLVFMAMEPNPEGRRFDIPGVGAWNS